MRNERQKLGKWGEDLAAKYLVDKGYSIIAQNYFTPHGELDIVAEKSGLLLFVEVKTRRSHSFSYPEDSVTKRKQAYLLAAAEHFMEFHSGNFDAWQFDVIAVEHSSQQGISINHFENVLQ